MHATPRRSARRGSVTPFVLVMLSAFLAALALALNPAWLWSSRAELQAAADSSSIAAAETLLDDDLLRGDPAAGQRGAGDRPAHQGPRQPGGPAVQRLLRFRIGGRGRPGDDHARSGGGRLPPPPRPPGFAGPAGLAVRSQRLGFKIVG